MKAPRLSKVAADLISTVRVYADEDAFRRDHRGRPPATFEFKSRHDELIQFAITKRLATLLTLVDWQRPDRFRSACRVGTSRPSWRPANASAANKRDLLTAALAPAAEAVLGRDWLAIRALAEQGGRAALWHDDPALAFSPAPGTWLGRTACVGHEGFAYYFVYGTCEIEWENALQAAGMKVCGSGAAAYAEHYQIVGELAGQ